MDARILRVNAMGQPLEWLSWQEAVCLYARDMITWSLGGIVRRVYGGRCRLTGEQSEIELPAIVASAQYSYHRPRFNPGLTNRALFARDNYQCMYCGGRFTVSQLSRDHIVPRSRGGIDRWENVVAACLRCNQRKSDFLLSEISMDLLALPYRPNQAEYLALINSHRIRGDQMDFLRTQFSKNNRIVDCSIQA